MYKSVINIYLNKKIIQKNPSLPIFILIFSSFFLAAQQDFINNRPQLKAKFIDSNITIDGNISSDNVWRNIKPITSLTQITPNFGSPVSEDTQIRIAYNNFYFYVSVICYDSSPEKIQVGDSRRDAALNDEDSFLFILDTFNDQQNGFLFGTNSDGKEFDAQINNEGVGNRSSNRQQGGVIGGTNINWDASWDVAVEKGLYGWSAEFAIPLRSIRFSPGKNKTWGINFQRNISKNTEIAYWAPLPLTFDIKRLSIAGKLNNLNLKNPKNLKLIPYVIGQSISKKNLSSSSVSQNGDLGADIKYSLTPGLTMDLTYNTDFAQVEVDEQQINIDRVNLFFPEKRAFFLENAGQFSVGIPGEIDLFFTRRIGLENDGSIVPILGGGRLSGKIGQTNIGLLNMSTEGSSDSSMSKNNFSVIRVNHDFSKSRSSFGGIFVNKFGLGENDNYNRVFALDGKLGLGKKAQLSGFFSKSNSPNITENDHAFAIKAEYNWDGWRLNASFSQVGEGFNPEVGFLQRNAYYKPEFLIWKTIRTGRKGPLFEIRPHIYRRTFYKSNNQLFSDYLHVDNHWVWPSGFEIHTGINFTREVVYSPFKISNIEIGNGDFSHSELQFVAQTNPNKNFFWYNKTYIGGYYGGKRTQFINSINLSLGNRFNADLNYNYTRLVFEDKENLNSIIAGLRLSFQFTPKIFIQSLIQRNNITNVNSINARFGWLQTANTGLFIVYNIVRDLDWFDEINDSIFSIKYTYQFDVL